MIIQWNNHDGAAKKKQIDDQKFLTWLDSGVT